ncbi:MAG: hypothetical protein HY904_23020 [Deltaproteobacteria bacterium]|nr:hypothetical protein [Deltaproteobacteria bacterium]
MRSIGRGLAVVGLVGLVGCTGASSSSDEGASSGGSGNTGSSSSGQAGSSSGATSGGSSGTSGGSSRAGSSGGGNASRSSSVGGGTSSSTQSSSLTCGAGLIACDARCVDPLSDPDFCGARLNCQGTNAGTQCVGNKACMDGYCTFSCPRGLVACTDPVTSTPVCVDPTVSSQFCGARADCQGTNAGRTCTGGEVCDGNGGCSTSCQAGLVTCGGGFANAVTATFQAKSGSLLQGSARFIEQGTSSTQAVITVVGASQGQHLVRAHASGDCSGPDASNVGAAYQSIGVLFVDSSGAGALTVTGGYGTADMTGRAIVLFEDAAGTGARIGCGVGGAPSTVPLPSECINPQSDPRFCGAGADCSASQGDQCTSVEACQAGVCAPCPSGEVACGGYCIDPLADERFCGAQGDCLGGNAGDACGTNAACTAGTCAPCPSGTVLCDGACTDPTTSHDHCGALPGCFGSAAGTECGASQQCVGGQCVTCGAPFLTCDRTCVDPRANDDFCGATADCAGANAGAACTSNEICTSGTCTACPNATDVNCNHQCINPARDERYCGASASCTGVDAGDACTGAEYCIDGTCVACPAPGVVCGTTCIDPTNDDRFCGATLECGFDGVGSAGQQCDTANFQHCVNRVCTLVCPPGTFACGNTCVDPAVDNAHCGATPGCGISGVGSAGSACTGNTACNGNGECSVLCIPPLVKCGNRCIDPYSDNTYCGAQLDCTGANDGTTCATGSYCSDGLCQATCDVGFILCGGRCVDPSMDRTYCGARLNCAGENAGDACILGEECYLGLCAPSTQSYVGSLPRQNGRWSYGGVVGLPGAVSTCRQYFGASTDVCTYPDMVNAETRGDLVDPVDTGFAQVDRWWIHVSTTLTLGGATYPTGADYYCGNNNDGQAPWTYPTGDQGHSGYFVAVADRAAGTITGMTVTGAGGNFCRDSIYNVSCCLP